MLFSLFSLSFLVSIQPFIPTIQGAITTATCDTYGECITQRAGTDTWCYHPNPSWPRTGASCAPDAAQFSRVMPVHIAQTQYSVAYYDLDLNLLGGPSTPVPTGVSTYFCYSGQLGDGSYQTTCNYIDKDNSLGFRPFCSPAIGQIQVGDGCYPPDTSETARNVAAQAVIPPGTNASVTLTGSARPLSSGSSTTRSSARFSTLSAPTSTNSSSDSPGDGLGRVVRIIIIVIGVMFGVAVLGGCIAGCKSSSSSYSGGGSLQDGILMTNSGMHHVRGRW